MVFQACGNNDNNPDTPCHETGLDPDQAGTPTTGRPDEHSARGEEVIIF